MERVKSNKLTEGTTLHARKETSAAPVAPPPKPAPLPVQRVVVTADPDPASVPQYSTHGYGDVVLAFSMGKGDVDIFYRSRPGDDGTEVRVYYAGEILLGALTISPLLVTGKFRRGTDRYESVDHFHRALAKMLQGAP